MVEGPPGYPGGPSITCSSSTLAGDFGPLHRGPISRPYPTRDRAALMASASAQEKIDEPTGKFFRLPGNTANTPLVKLRAQAWAVGGSNCKHQWKLCN
jgi:hypothetical protein